jgi:hypothetical protein
MKPKMIFTIGNGRCAMRHPYVKAYDGYRDTARYQHAVTRTLVLASIMSVWAMVIILLAGYLA